MGPQSSNFFVRTKREINISSLTFWAEIYDLYQDLFLARTAVVDATSLDTAAASGAIGPLLLINGSKVVAEFIVEEPETASEARASVVDRIAEGGSITWKTQGIYIKVSSNSLVNGYT